MFQSPLGELDLRSANMQARRERILDAALELIASSGADGVSMRKLAKRAELSVQTLYNLFGSREAILLALAQRFTADVEGLVANDRAIDDPVDRLRAMFSTAIAKLAAGESTYRPMLLALFRGAARAPEWLGVVWQRVATMAAPALTEARERGLLRDDFAAESFAQHVLEAYAWNLQQWAEGFIDHRTLKARAIYGLTVALLAVASDDVRPRLRQQLRSCERAHSIARGGEE